MKSNHSLPIVARRLEAKGLFRFIGNGFLVDSKFITVAHNFPDKEWIYFAVNDGELLPIDEEESFIYEILELDEYEGASFDLVDLIVFDFSNVTDVGLKFANLELAVGETAFICGHYQEPEDREEEFELAVLLSKLKYDGENRVHRRTPPDQGAMCQIPRPVLLRNCFTLDGEGYSGLSGSPVLNADYEVLGMLCLSTSGSNARNHSISASYIEQKLKL